MSRNKKIQLLTDLFAGRITKEDLAADRIYFNEKVERGGKIVSERITYQGKEVTTVPRGATIWKEVKTYE